MHPMSLCKVSIFLSFFFVSLISLFSSPYPPPVLSSLSHLIMSPSLCLPFSVSPIHLLASLCHSLLFFLIPSVSALSVCPSMYPSLSLYMPPLCPSSMSFSLIKTICLPFSVWPFPVRPSLSTHLCLPLSVWPSMPASHHVSRSVSDPLCHPLYALCVFVDTGLKSKSLWRTLIL